MNSRGFFTSIRPNSNELLQNLYRCRSLIFVSLLHQCEMFTKKNNLIKKYSFKINFNPGGGHLTWTFCPKTCRFCLSVLLLCYTTFDFLFGSFEQKREKNSLKSCKMSRILVPRLKDVRNSRPSNCVRAEPWKSFNYKSSLFREFPLQQI